MTDMTPTSFTVAAMTADPTLTDKKIRTMGEAMGFSASSCSGARWRWLRQSANKPRHIKALPVKVDPRPTDEDAMRRFREGLGS